MKWLDADVSALQSPLQKTPEVSKSIGVNLAVNVAFRVIDHIMGVVPNQTVIRLQLVAEQGRARRYVILNFLIDCILSTIRKKLCADLATALQDSHDMFCREGRLRRTLRLLPFRVLRVSAVNFFARLREAQKINQEEGEVRGIRNVSLMNIEKIARGLKKSLAELFGRV